MCWWALTLLREGLDMPEVSLVAILDADKEGFLRSEGSLIQTMGRAARNLNGRAILYADKITGSMQRAMGETGRRREKQIEHNKLHWYYVPKSVTKSIADVMEGARSTSTGSKSKRGNKVQPITVPDSPKALGKLITQMEKQMLKHAQDLEFEEAAHVRDQLHQLRAKTATRLMGSLGISEVNVRRL